MKIAELAPKEKGEGQIVFNAITYYEKYTHTFHNITFTYFFM